MDFIIIFSLLLAFTAKSTDIWSLFKAYICLMHKPTHTHNTYTCTFTHSNTGFLPGEIYHPKNLLAFCFCFPLRHNEPPQTGIAWNNNHVIAYDSVSEELWQGQWGRTQGSLTHMCAIWCWMLAGAFRSPSYRFSLSVFPHPQQLSLHAACSGEGGRTFFHDTHFQRDKEKLQDLLRLRLRTNSNNNLPPDFFLYEKNKLLNVCTVPVGYYVLWLSNSFGHRAKRWLIWVLSLLFPHPSLLLASKTKAFLRQPGISLSGWLFQVRGGIPPFCLLHFELIPC